MPVRDYSIYTGFRRGGVAEFQITGTRRGGGVEIPVGPVTPAAPVNTVAPVTSGTTTLTSTTGTFTGGSGALSYQTRWQRSTDSGTSWAVISGQTGLTYDASAETAGNQIRSQRQATDAMGQTSGWASSNVTTIGAAAVAPARTTASTLTLTGDTISSAGSVWTGTAPLTFQYGWQRRTAGGGTWTNIVGFEPGASVANTFTRRPEDAGYDVRMTERAINSAGSTGNLTSANFITFAAATAPANTVAPVIAGGAAEGDAYVHADDTWTGSTPMTPTYRWELSVANGPWTQFSTAASPTRTSDHAGNRVRLTKTMTNSAGSASATSNIITVEAEGGSVIAGTLTNPPVSARLGIINERSARPFINAFKQAWEWEGNNLGGNWSALRSAGHISAGGQIVSMPSGSDAGIRTRALDSLTAESGATGRWRLTWTGAGTFDVFGASNETSSANSIEFDYTANGGSWITVVARSAPISNIALVHEDDWADHAAGRIFRDQYLEEVRNYRTLRFDEWTGILRDEPYGLAVTTWDSRPLPTDETFQNRFVPLEWQAELCNLVGADLWVCAPTAATADYDTGAATLIQSLMQAPRRVYAEYSTKTWDFAGTPQAHYCAEQGRIAFGTTANPTEQEFRSWYGMRSALMAQRWRAVWGSNTRLVTVIQHQADWVGGEYDVLVAPMWQERDGTLGLPAYVAPHSVCDMLTVHAQIDGGMAYGSAASLLETWRTTLTQTEAFNRIRDQLLTGPYHGVGDDGRRTVQLLTPKWQHYRTVANTYGLELAAYEVGNHLNGVGGSADLRAFMHLFSVSAQMGEVYTATFAAIRAAGFDGPLCMSVECRLPDDNIMHGLQRYLGDHNPAWTAVNAINLANDGPTGRGAGDFVGTAELA